MLYKKGGEMRRWGTMQYLEITDFPEKSGEDWRAAPVLITAAP
jgi:hypothetical protein